LEDEAKQLGLEALHRQLHDIDPTAAARIHAHDAQRIQRALEVYYLTGTPLTELLAQQTSGSDYRFVNFSLFPEQRSWLHERIELRFDQMLADGFVDEVKRIQEQWDIDPNAPSMRCVGYRQVLEYLQGEIDASTMRDKGIAATRQLAKRQLTWLRHWPDTMVFDPQISTFSEEIIAKTREILDNGFL